MDQERIELCELLKPLSPLSEYMGGEVAVPGLLYAIDAFTESDVLFKQYRKAVLLKAAGANDFLKRALAFNAVGIRRLNSFLKDFDAVAGAFHGYEKTGPGRVKSNNWNRIVKEEIVPDISARLLESGMSSGEVSIWVERSDSLCDPRSWSTSRVAEGVGRLPAMGAALLKERRSIHRMNKNTQAKVPAAGVPKWKVIATKIVKVLIRVAIRICKTWRRIISKLVEIVWRLVRKWVERKIYGWCRDGRPAPVQP